MTEVFSYLRECTLGEDTAKRRSAEADGDGLRARDGHTSTNTFYRRHRHRR